ncbi:MAG: type II restriction endonuclease, partial [Armatimonadota bacterium]|nr:type II restriction endonuclease [Armatimonadota bacterium]
QALKEEIQGSRGLVAWVRQQVIPEGRELARLAQERVWSEYWKDQPPTPQKIAQHVDALLCSLLDKEYEIYLEYERECARQAPELVLSEEGARHFPNAAKLLRSALQVIADSQKPPSHKLGEIAGYLRPFYQVFEQSLAQGRRGRAGGSAQLHIEYLLHQLGYTGEFETQQVLNGKVDFLFPSKAAWERDRQRCIIVSVKRSIRERYKQVFEELDLTKGLTIYLIVTEPLEEARKDLTSAKVEHITQQNIYLVVRDAVKEAQFSKERQILGFTQFFNEELPLRRQLWKPLLQNGLKVPE